MKKIRGLLLKDIFQTKSYFITIFLICLLFMIITIIEIIAFFYGESFGVDPESPNDLDVLKSFLNTSFFYFCIFPIYSCGGIALSFQQDERCNFDKFAISSGISRKVIIYEKAILGGLTAVPGLIFTLIVTILITATPNQAANFLVGLFLFLISCGGYLFAIGVSLVLCTFLGSVKGRVWTSLATILTLIIQAGAFVLYVAFGIDNVLYGSLIALIYLAISILFFVGSYFLSLKAYSNKEF